MEDGRYAHWNFDVPAPERRAGKHMNRKPERVVAEHNTELQNDPDKLDAEFLLSIIYRGKRV